MFKIDDKVVCVDPNKHLVLGKEYVIKSVPFGPDGLVKIEGQTQKFYSTRFKLVAVVAAPVAAMPEVLKFFEVGDVVYVNYVMGPYVVVNATVTLTNKAAAPYWQFIAPSQEQGNPTFYPGQIWTLSEEHLSHVPKLQTVFAADAAPVAGKPVALYKVGDLVQILTEWTPHDGVHHTVGCIGRIEDVATTKVRVHFVDHAWWYNYGDVQKIIAIGEPPPISTIVMAPPPNRKIINQRKAAD